MSGKEEVLEFLLKNGKVNALDAVKYGLGYLPKHIKNLRLLGYEIEAKKVSLPYVPDKLIAVQEYRLIGVKGKNES